jgi:hypothetical protein
MGFIEKGPLSSKNLSSISNDLIEGQEVLVKMPNYLKLGSQYESK